MDGRWPFKRQGAYYRSIKPCRVQRFQCTHCKRSFSTQTFSVSYWLKRPDVLPRLFMKTVGAMANRQIAREIRVAPSTVDRQLARLGRHCLLYQSRLLDRCRPRGAVIVDGFETFEYSQYFPFHHNLAVEVDSSFTFGFTDSPLRRKGRMRPDQRRRRAALEAELGRPDPKAVEKGVRELLRIVCRGVDKLTLHTDDHRAYPRAMRTLQVTFDHRVTRSTERRDAANDLFEVNLLDLLIRHSSANHRRETIAWSKRRNGSSLRLWILVVWRNCVKRRHEKGPPVSPAMLKGLARRLLDVHELLAERIFRSQVELPASWSATYAGKDETPALGLNRRHDLTYAY
ncbi:MAG: IS1 family transposase [Candidatus Latescibacteria bacterium]|nr:IS1 family transposase [Rhodocyclaceae bacterium]MCB9517093.1 IS1 family transposase [Candidatus Latescibacterota bacterium]